ncbi:MAG TPA: methyltransferase domain-containing protein [Blastocatellia bacterium]|nr:methyltransferase domain-containing protein [Blastocatellia bacterium]
MNHSRLFRTAPKAVTPEEDLKRLREDYADRRERLAGSDRYSLFNPGELFLIQQRQRELLALLRRAGCYPLKDRRILEVGCGAGGVLREFLSYGATPRLLHGAELLPWRISEAKAAAPHLPLVNGDGRSLPYPDGCFDIVAQFTVFSSILNDEGRQQLAREMRRVLRTDGVIVWYDFWFNPLNAQTRGLRRAEIRRLFPGCRYLFRRITLVPPLARYLAPHSWIACYLLERIGLFNTHYLAMIRPEP